MFLAKTDNWYMERIIWLLAGVFTIASVGFNQIVLSLTGFCPMTIFLNSVGCKSRIQ